MSKILLMDLDGVVIRPRHKYFSERYSVDRGVPLEDVLPFFKREYKEAARGRSGIRDVLPGYLEKWHWTGSVDSFLSYWFDSERTLDVNVLDIINDIRNKGVKVFLVSDNEKERANYVMKELGLEKVVDGAFFSYELGVTKEEHEFFRKIVERLKLDPAQIEYWDDDPANTKVAQEVGIEAHIYTSFSEFKEKIKDMPA